jgi:inner membrane transporter RhtA
MCDQLAMAKLPRASFALFLSLLPAFAAVIGACVLHQIPTSMEAVGIVFITAAVAFHRAQQA